MASQPAKHAAAGDLLPGDRIVVGWRFARFGVVEQIILHAYTDDEIAYMAAMPLHKREEAAVALKVIGRNGDIEHACAEFTLKAIGEAIAFLDTHAESLRVANNENIVGGSVRKFFGVTKSKTVEGRCIEKFSPRDSDTIRGEWNAQAQAFF